MHHGFLEAFGHFRWEQRTKIEQRIDLQCRQRILSWGRHHICGTLGYEVIQLVLALGQRSVGGHALLASGFQVGHALLHFRLCF